MQAPPAARIGQTCKVSSSGTVFLWVATALLLLLGPPKCIPPPKWPKGTHKKFEIFYLAYKGTPLPFSSSALNFSLLFPPLVNLHPLFAVTQFRLFCLWHRSFFLFTLFSSPVFSFFLFFPTSAASSPLHTSSQWPLPGEARPNGDWASSLWPSLPSSSRLRLWARLARTTFKSTAPLLVL